MPVIVERVRKEWSAIIAKRRALLVMPALNVLTLPAAIASDGEAAAFIVGALLAAEQGISIGPAAEIRTLLGSFRDNA